ncbi:hypothetical protein AV654_19840 [Paenibacillus elgii]|uniref:DNA primase DNAG catalytic core N-terminal domain-containing protein n=1 Tax=Paenibacillus elgii TaxID=189691 RepID=A0A163XPG9_9BACL|nr:toprim domain-containing protein [Paenibacillus elgii]KZE78228.1 hypothetical protein AV654_19840 [Paenibacillus elgii]
MPFYPREIQDQLNQTPIDVLMIEEGEVVSGREFMCPKCGGGFDNGKIVPHDNYFICFRCKTLGRDFKGKPINYIQLKYGLSLPEAVEYLAQRSGVTLPMPQYSSEEKDKLRVYQAVMHYYERCLAETDYLFKRGISEEVASRYRVGFAPGYNRLKHHLLKKGFTLETIVRYNVVTDSGDRYFNRVIFPLLRNGLPYSFYTRRTDGGEASKHLNHDHSPISYGEDSIPVGVEVLDLYESVINKLVAETAGYPHGYAFGGCASFRKSHLTYLKKVNPTRIRLILDADLKAQGQTAAFRLGEILTKAGFVVEVVLLPLGYDAASLIVSQGKDAFKECLGQALPYEEYRAHFLMKDIPIELIQKHMIARGILCYRSLSQLQPLKSLFLD